MEYKGPLTKNEVNLPINVLNETVGTAVAEQEDPEEKRELPNVRYHLQSTERRMEK